MEALKEWAAALCGAVVLCCAANLIAPEGKNRKMMQAVLSLVMLCVLISPLRTINSCRTDFSALEKQVTEPGERLLDTVEQQTCDRIEMSLNDLVESELYSMDIIPEKISVDTDISPDGCISIGQVTVTVRSSSADQCGRIKDILKQRLGLDAETLISEDENSA